jgi:3-dehydroquinate synthase
MGTGKTAVATRLAEMLGLRFVDTDTIVEQRVGYTVADIFERNGEAYFRDAESEALREVLQEPGAVISTGGGILLREENGRLLSAAGPLICLDASPRVIHERTRHDGARPLLAGPGDPISRITALLAERQPSYAKCRVHIDTDDLTAEGVAQAVVEALREDGRAVTLLPGGIKVPVSLRDRSYRIHVGSGCLSRIGCLCPPKHSQARAAVLISEALPRRHVDIVERSLVNAGWGVAVLTVPDGEPSKSLQVASRLYEELLDARLDRGSMMFALGGGVVGDLGGFVAATFLRGIDYAQIPTSLIAQVDSSIGGKTGVNLSRGKNLVGAFHHPRGVVIDTDVLGTLPPRELRSGLAEVIKHAAIADAELFEYLERQIGCVLDLDPLCLRYVIARNCQIKAEIVSADPYDRGVRGILNYGHTVGHALEKAAGEWELRHGEAVALGIVAESRLAARIGISTLEMAERQEALMRAAGLPSAAERVDFPHAAAAMGLDKKIEYGRLKVSLVPTIGKAQTLEDVDRVALENALRSVCAG